MTAKPLYLGRWVYNHSRPPAPMTLAPTMTAQNNVSTMDMARSFFVIPSSCRRRPSGVPGGFITAAFIHAQLARLPKQDDGLILVYSPARRKRQSEAPFLSILICQNREKKRRGQSPAV